MEFRGKSYDLFKPISEKLWSLNSLNIAFPYSYALETVSLNWYDVLFAIENEFLSHNAAIEHAVNELGKDNDSSQAVLDLAILSPDKSYPHSIHPYIDELASLIPEQEKSKTKGKLLYVLLKWVYEHRVEYDDLFQVWMSIADDFGFPEIMTDCIGYKTTKESDLGFNAPNDTKLVDKWKGFLDHQKLLYKAT